MASERSVNLVAPCPESLAARVKAAAAEEEVSVAEIVRCALRAYFAIGGGKAAEVMGADPKGFDREAVKRGHGLWW